MRARSLAPLAAVVGLLAVSGCTLTGQAVVTSDHATLDLEVEHAAPFSSSEGYVRSGPCDSGSFLPGLDIIRLDAAEGRRRCTVKGTIPLSRDGAEWSEYVSYFVTTTKDAVIVRVPPGWPGDPQSEALVAVDLTLRLPGEVITSNANDFGATNELRWTDPALVSSQGMTAVARNSAGVPSWMLPSAIGVLVGAAGTLLWPRVRSRVAALQAPPTEEADAEASNPEAHALDEPRERAEDPSVWADEGKEEGPPGPGATA